MALRWVLVLSAVCACSCLDHDVKKVPLIGQYDFDEYLRPKCHTWEECTRKTEEFVERLLRNNQHLAMYFLPSQITEELADRNADDDSNYDYVCPFESLAVDVKDLVERNSTDKPLFSQNNQQKVISQQCRQEEVEGTEILCKEMEGSVQYLRVNDSGVYEHYAKYSRCCKGVYIV